MPEQILQPRHQACRPVIHEYEKSRDNLAANGQQPKGQKRQQQSARARGKQTAPFFRRQKQGARKHGNISAQIQEERHMERINRTADRLVPFHPKRVRPRNDMAEHNKEYRQPLRPFDILPPID
jgi:hypothetical protein